MSKIFYFDEILLKSYKNTKNFINYHNIKLNKSIFKKYFLKEIIKITFDLLYNGFLIVISNNILNKFSEENKNFIKLIIKFFKKNINKIYYENEIKYNFIENYLISKELKINYKNFYKFCKKFGLDKIYIKYILNNNIL